VNVPVRGHRKREDSGADEGTHDHAQIHAQAHPRDAHRDPRATGGHLPHPGRTGRAHRRRRRGLAATQADAGRLRRAWHLAQRGDLRPVPHRDPAADSHGHGDAVGHDVVRPHARLERRGGRRHLTIRPVHRRHRGCRRGTQAGRADRRHHERSRLAAGQQQRPCAAAVRRTGAEYHGDEDLHGAGRAAHATRSA